jgi:broad specificity phosphatase PhoE
MSTIYLVRHGQASFGTDDYDRLSSLGRQQSSLVGEHLAASGQAIDRIYTGALRRQRETAELIAANLPTPPPIAIEPAFDEYDSEMILHDYAASLSPAELAAAGWPDMKTDRRRFQLFLERAARAWIDSPSDAQHSWRTFHGRITAAFARVMQEEGRGKTLLISTSGGVIGTIVAHVLGLANHTGIELNWAVHNASLTRLIYSAEKVSLSMFNALPHLEREGRWELVTYR